MSNKSGSTVRPSLYVVNFPTIFVAKSKDGVLHQQWVFRMLSSSNPQWCVEQLQAMIRSEKFVVYAECTGNESRRAIGTMDYLVWILHDFTSWIDVPNWQLQLSNSITAFCPSCWISRCKRATTVAYCDNCSRTDVPITSGWNGFLGPQIESWRCCRGPQCWAKIPRVRWDILCFRLPSPKKKPVELVVSWCGGRTWCQEVWASLNRLNLYESMKIPCRGLPFGAVTKSMSFETEHMVTMDLLHFQHGNSKTLLLCVCILPQNNTFTAFTYLCPKQICGHVSSGYFLHSSLNLKMRRIRIVKGWQARWNRPSGTPSRRFPLSQCQTRALVCTWGTCPAGKHESSKSRWWKWKEMFGGLFQENE